MDRARGGDRFGQLAQQPFHLVLRAPNADDPEPFQEAQSQSASRLLTRFLRLNIMKRRRIGEIRDYAFCPVAERRRSRA